MGVGDESSGGGDTRKAKQASLSRDGQRVKPGTPTAELRAPERQTPRRPAGRDPIMRCIVETAGQHR